KRIHEVNDPLGKYVDLVAFNEYLGWYGGLPDKCRTANWGTPDDKPLFISETGAGAKYGFHSDSLTRFSEEYQKWYYEEQIAMLKRMPDNFVGLSPWVLNDFRSPKRNNPAFQNGWNRKGLFDNQGHKKEAFYVLKKYYQGMEIKHPDE
ncbi:MAG: beta-glucuronidase, partial [Chitinophagaceae bacterium]